MYDAFAEHRGGGGGGGKGGSLKEIGSMQLEMTTHEDKI